MEQKSRTTFLPWPGFEPRSSRLAVQHSNHSGPPRYKRTERKRAVSSVRRNKRRPPNISGWFFCQIIVLNPYYFHCFFRPKLKILHHSLDIHIYIKDSRIPNLLQYLVCLFSVLLVIIGDSRTRSLYSWSIYYKPTVASFSTIKLANAHSYCITISYPNDGTHNYVNGAVGTKHRTNNSPTGQEKLPAVSRKSTVRRKIGPRLNF